MGLDRFGNKKHGEHRYPPRPGRPQFTRRRNGYLVEPYGTERDKLTKKQSRKRDRRRKGVKK